MEKFNINTNTHRRLNILTGEWVLVSPHRFKRPWQGKTEQAPKTAVTSYDKKCYLCPGNVRVNGVKSEDYKDVYIFTNDFGALSLETPVGELEENNLLMAESEKGICKVICFSPNHGAQLGHMHVADILKVVKAWKKEYRELGAMPEINHVQIFENKGEMMGCSNPHPHGQIWAQHSIPNEVLKEQQQQLAYFKLKGATLLADYLKLELKKQERIVFENSTFAVLVPFWAIWPYETIIISKRAISNLTELTPNEEQGFAECIKVLAAKYDKVFDTPFPYSSGIHQCPTDGRKHPEWHLHMHFYPPLLRSAMVKKFMVGYEMMAGPQRDITPESAAKILREV